MKPFTLALIGCSATKLGRVAAARDLYQGGLFKLSLAVAERWADRALILSARHHLVALEEALEPYDERLPNQREMLAGWGRVVGERLCSALGVTQDDTEACERAALKVLALAPGPYLQAIDFPCKEAWSQPLRGLGIGQQKAKLAELRRQGPAAENSKEAGHARRLARRQTARVSRSQLRQVGSGASSPEGPRDAASVAPPTPEPSLARLILDLEGAYPGDGEMLLPVDVWRLMLERARAEVAT